MQSRSKLVIALILAAAVAVLEFWGGAAAHSIALTTDAVHVCMDVFALAVALIAVIGATRPANRRKTFGYGRIEILGALLNGTLLLGATIVIVYQALLRFHQPLEPHGATMTIVATIGLALNVTIGLTLASVHSHAHGAGHAHAHVHDDLNLRAVLYHVLGDALGALAVIIGGIIIIVSHRAWVDPLLSLFVAAMIVAGVINVLRDAADVVLEATPRGIDSGEVEERLRAIGGVADVHDLHVWTIASGTRVMSAHVVLQDQRISEGSVILDALRLIALDRYGIGHVTVQLEAEHCDPGGIIICRPIS